MQQENNHNEIPTLFNIITNEAPLVFILREIEPMASFLASKDHNVHLVNKELNSLITQNITHLKAELKYFHPTTQWKNLKSIGIIINSFQHHYYYINTSIRNSVRAIKSWHELYEKDKLTIATILNTNKKIERLNLRFTRKVGLKFADLSVFLNNIKDITLSNADITVKQDRDKAIKFFSQLKAFAILNTIAGIPFFKTGQFSTLDSLLANAIQLKKIILQGHDLADDQPHDSKEAFWNALKNLKQLNHIEIINAKLNRTPEDLDFLKNLTALQTLILNNQYIRGSLSFNSSIKLISLTNCDFENILLQADKYPNLNEITIEGCTTNIEEFSLTDAENLKKILFNSPNTKKFRLFGNFNQLNELNLSCDELNELSLPSTPNLKKIRLETPKLDQGFFSFLFTRGMEEITHLELVNNPNIKVLSFSENQKALKSIHLKQCESITHIHLPKAAKRTLESFIANKCQIFDKKNIQQAIKSFEQLRELKFIGVDEFSHQFNDPESVNVYFSQPKERLGFFSGSALNKKKISKNPLTFITSELDDNKDWIVIEGTEKTNSRFFVNTAFSKIKQNKKSPTGDEQTLNNCHNQICQFLSENKISFEEIDNMHLEQIATIKQICFETLWKLPTEGSARQVITSFLTRLHANVSGDWQTPINITDLLQICKEYKGIYNFITESRSENKPLIISLFNDTRAIFTHQDFSDKEKIISILKICVFTALKIERGTGRFKSKSLSVIEKFTIKIMNTLQAYQITLTDDPKNSLLCSEELKNIAFDPKKRYIKLTQPIIEAFNQQEKEVFIQDIRTLRALAEVMLNSTNYERLSCFINKIKSTQEELQSGIQINIPNPH